MISYSDIKQYVQATVRPLISALKQLHEDRIAALERKVAELNDRLTMIDGYTGTDSSDDVTDDAEVITSEKLVLPTTTFTPDIADDSSDEDANLTVTMTTTVLNVDPNSTVPLQFLELTSDVDTATWEVILEPFNCELVIDKETVVSGSSCKLKNTAAKLTKLISQGQVTTGDLNGYIKLTINKVNYQLLINIVHEIEDDSSDGPAISINIPANKIYCYGIASSAVGITLTGDPDEHTWIKFSPMDAELTDWNTQPTVTAEGDLLVEGTVEAINQEIANLRVVLPTDKDGGIGITYGGMPDEIWTIDVVHAAITHDEIANTTDEEEPTLPTA